MTARRRFRRTHHRPALLAAGLLVALVVADAALHVLGWLLLTAAIAAGAYLAGQHRRAAGPRPVQAVTRAATSADTNSRTAGPAVQLGRVTAERDQLAAEAADLRRQLAAAVDAAHAAWDAAASITPQPPAEPHDTGGKRAALLADPRSGARPLVGR
jgi:hypothetical protein